MLESYEILHSRFALEHRYMGGASLNAAVEIVSGNFSDYAFIVNPAMMWGRAGAYDVSDSSVRVVRLIKYYEYHTVYHSRVRIQVQFHPHGLKNITIYFNANSSSVLAKHFGSSMAFSFSSNKLITFSTNRLSSDDIKSSIDASLKVRREFQSFHVSITSQERDARRSLISHETHSNTNA